MAGSVLRDAGSGYSLTYPAGWVVVETGSPADFHFLASRTGLMNARGLTGSDFWFSAVASAPDPTIRCGAPLGSLTQIAISMDGVAGNLYTRRGVQDSDFPTGDAIAERGGRCYHLQLTGGPAVATTEVGNLLGTIALSFRFNQ